MSDSKRVSDEELSNYVQMTDAQLAFSGFQARAVIKELQDYRTVMPKVREALELVVTGKSESGLEAYILGQSREALKLLDAVVTSDLELKNKGNKND